MPSIEMMIISVKLLVGKYNRGRHSYFNKVMKRKKSVYDSNVKIIFDYGIQKITNILKKDLEIQV